MRRAVLRTAFFLAGLSLTLVILVPGYLLMDGLVPMRPGPTGHHGGDRLFPGVLVVGLCVALANRVTSSAFLAVGLADGRWSIFDDRRRRRRRRPG